MNSCRSSLMAGGEEERGQAVPVRTSSAEAAILMKWKMFFMMNELSGYYANKPMHRWRRMGLSVGWVVVLDRSFSFVVELGRNAFSRANVRTRSKINRLVDAARFLERVEIAALHHGPRYRNIVVGWDGDVASGAYFLALEQDQ